MKWHLSLQKQNIQIISVECIMSRAFTYPLKHCPHAMHVICEILADAVFVCRCTAIFGCIVSSSSSLTCSVANNNTAPKKSFKAFVSLVWRRKNIVTASQLFLYFGIFSPYCVHHIYVLDFSSNDVLTCGRDSVKSRNWWICDAYAIFKTTTNWHENWKHLQPFALFVLSNVY